MRGPSLLFAKNSQLTLEQSELIATAPAINLQFFCYALVKVIFKGGSVNETIGGILKHKNLIRVIDGIFTKAKNNLSSDTSPDADLRSVLFNINSCFNKFLIKDPEALSYFNKKKNGLKRLKYYKTAMESIEALETENTEPWQEIKIIVQNFLTTENWEELKQLSNPELIILAQQETDSSFVLEDYSPQQSYIIEEEGLFKLAPLNLVNEQSEQPKYSAEESKLRSLHIDRAVPEHFSKRIRHDSGSMALC